jgi:hypothetical protein
MIAIRSNIINLNGPALEPSLYPVNILKLTAMPVYMTGIICIDSESNANANNRCGYNRD